MREKEEEAEERGSHFSPTPSLHLDFRTRSKWSETTRFHVPGIKVL